jgi:hypothetical protein
MIVELDNHQVVVEIKNGDAGKYSTSIISKVDMETGAIAGQERDWDGRDRGR